MKCVCSLDIAAPADRIFELLRDPEKHPLWLQGVEETRFLGDYDTANPVGAKFKQRIREGRRVREYDGVVTDFARPKHFGIRLSGPQFSVQVDYRLTPLAAGTRLDYTAEVACNSWLFRVLGRLFSWFTRMIVRKQLAKLKELAERGP